MSCSFDKEIAKVKRGCGELEKTYDPNKRSEKIYVSLKDQKQVSKTFWKFIQY